MAILIALAVAAGSAVLWELGRLCAVAESLCTWYQTCKDRWFTLLKLSLSEVAAGALTVGVVGLSTVLVSGIHRSSGHDFGYTRSALGGALIALIGIGALTGSGMSVRLVKEEAVVPPGQLFMPTRSQLHDAVLSIQPWWKRWRAETDLALVYRDRMRRISRLHAVLGRVSSLSAAEWTTVLQQMYLVAQTGGYPADVCEDSELRSALVGLEVNCAEEILGNSFTLVDDGTGPSGNGTSDSTERSDFWYASQVMVRSVMLQVDGPIRQVTNYTDEFWDLMTVEWMDD